MFDLWRLKNITHTLLEVEVHMSVADSINFVVDSCVYRLVRSIVEYHYIIFFAPEYRNTLHYLLLIFGSSYGSILLMENPTK